MTSSIGMMTFPIYGKIKHVPKHQPEMGMHPFFFNLFDVVLRLLKVPVSSVNWDDVERIAVKSGNFPLRMKYSGAPAFPKESFEVPSGSLT